MIPCSLASTVEMMNTSTQLTTVDLIGLYTVYRIYLGKAIPYRPRKALRAPGGRGSQVFRHSAHEGGKGVSPTHRPPLPPGNTPGTHFS
jgi:hypothetical protein